MESRSFSGTAQTSNVQARLEASQSCARQCSRHQGAQRGEQSAQSAAGGGSAGGAGSQAIFCSLCKEQWLCEPQLHTRVRHSLATKGMLCRILSVHKHSRQHSSAVFQAVWETCRRSFSTWTLAATQFMLVGHKSAALLWPHLNCSSSL